MLEAQNMNSTCDLPEGIDFKIFEEFIKYLYFDDLSNQKWTVSESLFLCSLCDFYGLTNDRLQVLAEQSLKSGIDKFNVLGVLDQADKVGAHKIRKLCLSFLADNFDLFSTNAGQ